MAEKARVLYEETPPGLWKFAVLGVLVLALAGVSAYSNEKNWPTTPAQVATMAVAFGLVALLIYGLTRNRFRVTEEALEAGVSFWNYRVPIQDITSAELLDDLPLIIGWGMRMWGDTLYFITQRKQSVLVHKKSGHFKKVVLTARDPLKIIAGIQAAQKMGHEKQAEEAK